MRTTIPLLLRKNSRLNNQEAELTPPSMEVASPAWDSGQFNRRVSTFAYISLLITLLVIWLIVLKGVLQPFFIALGIYFETGSTLIGIYVDRVYFNRVECIQLKPPLQKKYDTTIVG